MNYTDLDNIIKDFADGKKINISDIEYDRLVHVTDKKKFDVLYKNKVFNIENNKDINYINPDKGSDGLFFSDPGKCCDCESELIEDRHNKYVCPNPACKLKIIPIVSRVMENLGIPLGLRDIYETNINVKTINELDNKYKDKDIKKLLLDDQINGMKDPLSYDLLYDTYEMLISQVE